MKKMVLYIKKLCLYGRVTCVIWVLVILLYIINLTAHAAQAEHGDSGAVKPRKAFGSDQHLRSDKLFHILCLLLGNVCIIRLVFLPVNAETALINEKNLI